MAGKKEEMLALIKSTKGMLKDKMDVSTRIIKTLSTMIDELESTKNVDDLFAYVALYKDSVKTLTSLGQYYDEFLGHYLPLLQNTLKEFDYTDDYFPLRDEVGENTTILNDLSKQLGQIGVNIKKLNGNIIKKGFELSASTPSTLSKELMPNLEKMDVITGKYVELVQQVIEYANQITELLCQKDITKIDKKALKELFDKYEIIRSREYSEFRTLLDHHQLTSQSFEVFDFDNRVHDEVREMHYRNVRLAGGIRKELSKATENLQSLDVHLAQIDRADLEKSLNIGKEKCDREIVKLKESIMPWLAQFKEQTTSHDTQKKYAINLIEEMLSFLDNIFDYGDLHAPGISPERFALGCLESIKNRIASSPKEDATHFTGVSGKSKNTLSQAIDNVLDAYETDLDEDIQLDRCMSLYETHLMKLEAFIQMSSQSKTGG